MATLVGVCQVLILMDDGCDYFACGRILLALCNLFALVQVLTGPRLRLTALNDNRAKKEEKIFVTLMALESSIKLLFAFFVF